MTFVTRRERCRWSRAGSERGVRPSRGARPPAERLRSVQEQRAERLAISVHVGLLLEPNRWSGGDHHHLPRRRPRADEAEHGASMAPSNRFGRGGRARCPEGEHATGRGQPQRRRSRKEPATSVSTPRPASTATSSPRASSTRQGRALGPAERLVRREPHAKPSTRPVQSMPEAQGPQTPLW